MRPPKRPIHVISTWVRRQPPKVKAFLAVVAGMSALVVLRAIVHDHDNLFVAAEAVHSVGISLLIYKIMKEKTCAGNFKFIFIIIIFTCKWVKKCTLFLNLDNCLFFCGYFICLGADNWWVSEKIGFLSY